MLAGGNDVKDVKMGNVTADRVMVGGQVAWSKPLRIAAHTNTAARNALRDRLTQLGLSHTTVTEIPFEIDVAGSTNLTDMFISMANLEVTPRLINTTGVTRTAGMFRGCQKLEVAPRVDLTNVTDASFMFDDCLNLRTSIDERTENLRNANYMFRSTPRLRNLDIKLRGRPLFYTSTLMISNSGLTYEPWFTPGFGSAVMLDYETNFNYATGVHNLNGHDGWEDRNHSNLFMEVSSTDVVNSSYTTSDGVREAGSRRNVTYRTDNHAISVRFDGVPPLAESAGVFLGASVNQGNEYRISVNNTRLRVDYSRGGGPFMGWDVPGGTVGAGDTLTFAKRYVSFSSVVLEVYINETLRHSISTSEGPSSLVSYRSYGIFSLQNRRLFQTFRGPGITYFRAFDFS